MQDKDKEVERLSKLLSREERKKQMHCWLGNLTWGQSVMMNMNVQSSVYKMYCINVFLHIDIIRNW